jgi:hypothetical protein
MASPDQKEVEIVFRNPSRLTEDFQTSFPITSSISDVKQVIHQQHTQKPVPAQQRIIFAGQLLRDNEKLADVLRFVRIAILQKLNRCFFIYSTHQFT